MKLTTRLYSDPQTPHTSRNTMSATSPYPAQTWTPIHHSGATKPVKTPAATSNTRSQWKSRVGRSQTSTQ